MFIRLMIGVVILVTSFPTITMAQEVMKLPDDVRKQMEFLVGDWSLTAEEDGKATTGFYSARWGSDGTCLTLTFRTDTHNSTGLSSWDPSTNQMVETWTGPATGRLELRFTKKSASVWDGTSTLSGIDGKVSTGKISFEKTSPDSFLYTEKTGDKTWKIENKRIVRTPGAANPHAKDLNSFVGNWEMVNEDGSKRIWLIDWNTRKQVLNNEMINLDAEGEPKWSLNGSIGWDTGLQKITNWCVTDSGDQAKFVWTKVDDTTWEAVNEAGNKTWRFTPMGDRLRVVTDGNESFYERH